MKDTHLCTTDYYLLKGKYTFKDMESAKLQHLQRALFLRWAKYTGEAWLNGEKW